MKPQPREVEKIFLNRNTDDLELVIVASEVDEDSTLHLELSIMGETVQRGSGPAHPHTMVGAACPHAHGYVEILLIAGVIREPDNERATEALDSLQRALDLARAKLKDWKTQKGNDVAEDLDARRPQAACSAAK